MMYVSTLSSTITNQDALKRSGGRTVMTDPVYRVRVEVLDVVRCSSCFR